MEDTDENGSIQYESDSFDLRIINKEKLTTIEICLKEKSSGLDLEKLNKSIPKLIDLLEKKELNLVNEKNN